MPIGIYAIRSVCAATRTNHKFSVPGIGKQVDQNLNSSHRAKWLDAHERFGLSGSRLARKENLNLVRIWARECVNGMVVRYAKDWMSDSLWSAYSHSSSTRHAHDYQIRGITLSAITHWGRRIQSPIWYLPGTTDPSRSRAGSPLPRSSILVFAWPRNSTRTSTWTGWWYRL